MKTSNISKALAIVSLAGGLLGLSQQSYAQEQHFSQYWLAPQFNTTTAAGASDFLQISAHYRRMNVADGLGLNTMALSGHLPFASANRRIGVASFSIVRESTGDLGIFSTTGFLAGYTHNVQLAERHQLLGGVQLGYMSSRLDYDNVTTDSQWQFGQYVGGDTGEDFVDGRSGRYQINVGLGYVLRNKDHDKVLELGIGGNNVNRGRYSYLENDDAEPGSVLLNSYVQWWALKNHSLELIPILRLQHQKGLTDYIGGLQLRKALPSGVNINQSHLGLTAYFSPENVTVLALQYAQPSYILGFSYDMAMGKELNVDTHDAVEITLAWRINKRPIKNINPVVEPVQILAERPTQTVVAPAKEDNLPPAPTPRPQPKPITQAEREIFEPDFSYEAGSAKLSPEAKKKLDEMAKVLVEHWDAKVLITGHTSAFDEKDDAQYRLSSERINSAKSYLVSKGVQAEQIRLENRGYEQPKAGNQTEEGRRKNRRIEFKIL